ncbi:MAG: hypothetical protein JW839_04135 [Candidatus Lokiarchaeota archaeon]|nr:hypothetical protein [Candidatus Lokiarchaeota archaeon]
MTDLVVALSYFDRKIGPTVYMEYPEKLGEEEKMTLNQIFDQTTSEGWFWHSLNTKDFSTSLNYYFEIKSDWARGLKEMLMCSIIFKQKLNSEKEHDVLSWLSDFVMKMHARQDLFKAFYPTPRVAPGSDPGAAGESDTETNQSYVLVMKWLKELYFSTKEEIRQKSDEEIIANLMVNPAVYDTIRKLSKHPVRLNELRSWFDEQQFNRDFEKIISILEEQKFIVINKIGPETFAILVKSIEVSRVPPTCAMDLIDKGDLPRDKTDLPRPVVDHYVGLVGGFFNTYKGSDDADKLKLFSAMAMPKHYNLIAELRNRPLPKTQIGAILRQGPVVATRINVLEDLKADNIIDEFEYQGMTYVMLKTDIDIVDQFPEYIQNALPPQDKIARNPRFLIPPQVAAEVREDLMDLFPADELLARQQHTIATVAAAPANGGGEPPAAQSDGLGSGLLDDSPFDVIVDKITSTFITSQPADVGGPKKSQHDADKD